MVHIARREHSRAELIEKLTSQGYVPAIAGEAVESLAGERLVDDARYAESFVRSHVARGQGPRRIRQAIAPARLDPGLVETALAQAVDWAALAREVRQRKFGAQPPEDWAERSRQARFLQYRGFSNDHIRSALGGSEADLELDADP
jgi:regulatory protein